MAIFSCGAIALSDRVQAPYLFGQEVVTAMKAVTAQGKARQHEVMQVD